MSTNRIIWGISVVLFLCSVAAVGLQSWPGAPAEALDPAASSWPLVFEANQGQTDASVKYMGRGNGTTLFLGSRDFVLQVCGGNEAREAVSCEAVEMSLVGASSDPEVSGLDPLPGVSNYFIGSPEDWNTAVRHFARVRYEQVYPGVDLVFYSSQGEFEYDFVVAPGIDPGIIRMAFAGAEALALDDGGNLVVPTPDGELVHRAPIIYQESDGERRVVQGEFVLTEEDLVGFAVGSYDEARPLVLDPMLSFSTYFGGSQTETPHTLAVDSLGNVYVAGETYSTNFPTKSALAPTRNSSPDAFVAKLAPGGKSLVFSTYLGGGGHDNAKGIAVDSAQNVYLTGWTSSTDFPTKDAYHDSNQGLIDAYMVKIDSSGASLLYGTFLGGSGYDYGYDIEVGPDGHVYLFGNTRSPNFPTVGAYDGILNNASPDTSADFYLTRMPPALSYLDWSTFLGGEGDENARAVAVDAQGNAYVTGFTDSTDFPTKNAYQQDFAGGAEDVVVVRMNSSGSSLGYSTYLGGNDTEQGNDIWVDGKLNAYVVSQTTSTNFPTVDAYQPILAGNTDTAIARFAADGALVSSTYLGGAGNDYGIGIGADESGSVYVVGDTDSTNFPTASPIQPAHGDPSGYDLFLTRLTSSAQSLAFSTFIGGSGNDRGFGGLAFDEQGEVYVLGGSESSDFPTFGALQAGNAGGRDLVILKVTTPLDFFIAAAPPAVAAVRGVVAGEE